MQRISKGTIGITRKGEIIVFENGNDGKKGEYQTYALSKKGKRELKVLFATPSDLSRAVDEGSEDGEKIRVLQAYLDGCGVDIEGIENIVNGKGK